FRFRSPESRPLGPGLRSKLRRGGLEFSYNGNEHETRRGSQVVRQRSAKPLFVGSTPIRASTSPAASKLHPPQTQPVAQIAREPRNSQKLPLSSEVPRRVRTGLGLNGFPRFQDQFNYLAMGLTLAVCHGLAVNVHRGLDAGVAHQLFLDGCRRSRVIQP